MRVYTPSFFFIIFIFSSDFSLPLYAFIISSMPVYGQSRVQSKSAPFVTEWRAALTPN